MEEEVLAVATAHTLLGYSDPRHNQASKIDYRLQMLLRSYEKEDPPPHRVKPVPVPVLQRAYEIAQATADERSLATADMMWLAFFFLGRPGEYTANSEDSTPFRACDTILFKDEDPVTYKKATEASMAPCNFVTEEFTIQKNSVCGEVVGHGPTSSTTANPVEVVKRRFLHLKKHSAPPTITLCSYYQNGKWKEVTSTNVTKLLRQAAAQLPQYNLQPRDISARSLRAAGAMALLCDNVDSDRIRLLGRWRSDEMLRYLHLQAKPIMEGFAERMLQGGNYQLLPNPNQALVAVA